MPPEHSLNPICSCCGRAVQTKPTPGQLEALELLTPRRRPLMVCGADHEDPELWVTDGTEHEVTIEPDGVVYATDATAEAWGLDDLFE
jgi:hypothetical protein